jgi:hypothetical protein
MHSNIRAVSVARHATLEEVCGPFGPYQEIVAGAAFALHSMTQGLRGLWAAVRSHGWHRGHRTAA